MKFATISGILALTNIYLTPENKKMTGAIFRKQLHQEKNPLGNRHHIKYIKNRQKGA